MNTKGQFLGYVFGLISSAAGPLLLYVLTEELALFRLPGCNVTNILIFAVVSVVGGVLGLLLGDWFLLNVKRNVWQLLLDGFFGLVMGGCGLALSLFLVDKGGFDSKILIFSPIVIVLLSLLGTKTSKIICKCQKSKCGL